jgi:hypothetical protein
MNSRSDKMRARALLLGRDLGASPPLVRQGQVTVAHSERSSPPGGGQDGDEEDGGADLSHMALPSIERVNRNRFANLFNSIQFNDLFTSFTRQVIRRTRSHTHIHSHE